VDGFLKKMGEQLVALFVWQLHPTENMNISKACRSALQNGVNHSSLPSVCLCAVLLCISGLFANKVVIFVSADDIFRPLHWAIFRSQNIL